METIINKNDIVFLGRRLRSYLFFSFYDQLSPCLCYTLRPASLPLIIVYYRYNFSLRKKSGEKEIWLYYRLLSDDLQSF